jgi:5-methylcytosine-specific restriction endonuclease McrA
MAAANGQRYCSARCRSRNGNRKPASRDARRNADYRRRARKKDAFVANVYRREIWERDGFTCQLCGDPLDMDAVGHNPAVEPYNPLAPTIDHIIPLAAGGTHEPANVQSAHFICNSVKGDRTFSENGDQLRLVV